MNACLRWSIDGRYSIRVSDPPRSRRLGRLGNWGNVGELRGGWSYKVVELSLKGYNMICTDGNEILYWPKKINRITLSEHTSTVGRLRSKVQVLDACGRWLIYGRDSIRVYDPSTDVASQ